MTTIPPFGWVRIVPGDESTLPPDSDKLVLVHSVFGSFVLLRGTCVRAAATLPSVSTWLNAPPPPEIKSAEKLAIESAINEYGAAIHPNEHFATAMFNAGIAFQKAREALK